jgi:hypothetical protein
MARLSIAGHFQRRFVAAALCITLMSSAVSQTTQTALAAPPNPILWGAWAGSSPLDPTTISQFEQRAGKRPSIIHWGQPWWHNNSYVPFSASDFDAVRERGAIPLIDWGSWDYSAGVNQPQFRLAEIARGTHDAYLIQWAQAARAWGHPLFVRFDPEMNGWWLPWSEQVNGNQQGDFARAWRHVVDVFRAQDADNVSFVWCPNVVGPKSTPLTGLYPGNDYVEWTGMDGYNWGTDEGNQWQTFSDVFSGSAYNGGHNTYQEVLDLAPNKPMMIAETGTSRNGGDPGAWVRDALNTQLPNNFPQVKALVWFNWDDANPVLSWPIESSPTIQAAFADSIGSSYFASNDFGNLAGSAVAPIGGLTIATVAPVAVDAVSPDLAALPA